MDKIPGENIPIKMTYRNFKGTLSLHQSMLRQLDELADRYHSIHWANCVFKIESFRHIVRVMVEKGHRRLLGEGVSADMYSSIALAIQKLEKQLVRFKE